MKYKVWGVLLCACAILLALVAPTLEEQDGHNRYHQHIEAVEKLPDTEKNKGFSTHLPLVKIDTKGVEVPGKIEEGEAADKQQLTTAEGEERTIHAQMDIVDNETTYNHAKDPAAMSSEITIHVRGNSSRAFEKSNYAIRLLTDTGENNPQEVMGMAAHHAWVLHGPYLDKTLMRNYMWFNIGGEIMDYAPNVRFCELMLNGKYQGVYVMMENITAGDDGARLPLTVSAKNNVFSGYLLQLNSNRKPANAKKINQFSYYTKYSDSMMEIVYPGKDNLTPEIQQGICQDFSDFEKAVYSYDYDSDKYGYPSMIDIESFIDYFLINELTCNYDAGWLSTYIYKDTDGKFHMCLWDLNSCCDNYKLLQTDPMSFRMQACLWYEMLIKDEDFVNAVIDRYWELRKTVFSEEYLFDYIDSTEAYLGDAIDRNYSRWGYTFEKRYDRLEPTERNPRTYEQSIVQMKDFLSKRIAWMDENIEALHSYSAESHVKKYSEVAN